MLGALCALAFAYGLVRVQLKPGEIAILGSISACLVGFELAVTLLWGGTELGINRSVGEILAGRGLMGSSALVIGYALFSVALGSIFKLLFGRQRK
jgi:hypothetical protein